MVQDLGANILLEVQPPLQKLISTAFKSVSVIARGNPLPDFDFYCPLMSLPLAFGTTIKTVPAAVPYLSIESSKQNIWKERLGIKKKPRIGLAWSGAIKHANDHNRSIALSLLAPLLLPEYEFHSLQKEVRPEDKKVLSDSQIVPHSDNLQDFSDTAALTAKMDLVISVDTSAAHLAGAFGKPVWILLPYLPDFRWMLEREDSPWYPTARLFRQENPNEWKTVIERVKKELTTYFGTKQ
jgi:hypothetical protein